MNPEFDESLLTAYLDDEVTDAERAQVEAHLRHSDTARKLLEELRSIRSMVTQLHLSQPSRDWQNGPWNANQGSSNRAPCESAPVVLLPAVPSMQWKVAIQRLASLAALVAIAACLSFLWMDPTQKSISRVEPQFAKTPPETAPKNTETFSLETDVGSSVTTQSHDPALKRWVESFFEEGGNQKPRTLAIDAFVQDEVRDPGIARGTLEKPRNIPETLSFTQKAEDEKEVAHFVWRLQPNAQMQRDTDRDSLALSASENVVQRGQPANSDTSLPSSRADRSTSETESRSEASPVKKKSGAPRSVLLEFQIPSEDWDAGAKRLQQLGVGVPLDLPTEDVLEFSASPPEPAPPVNLLVQPAKELELKSSRTSIPESLPGAPLVEYFFVPSERRQEQSRGVIGSTQATQFKQINPSKRIVRVLVRIEKQSWPNPTK